jgi:RNA 3'-terminal phosphate cyclase (ATP)
MVSPQSASSPYERLKWPRADNISVFASKIAPVVSAAKISSCKEMAFGIFKVDLAIEIQNAAHDLNIGHKKTCVLKHIVRYAGTNAFRREVLALSKTSPHPNIVSLAGLLEGQSPNTIDGLLLQYIDGIDLVAAKASAFATQDFLAYEIRASRWMGQIRKALDHLHLQNLVWGDAKPENIFIESETDNAVLIDFEGGTTTGWVSREFNGTQAGDEQGFHVISAWLKAWNSESCTIDERDPLWHLESTCRIANPRPIIIPGDMFEGGGQILRNSICMSVLTNQAVHISNVRAKRPRSGLTQQTQICAEWLADMSGSFLFGAELGSSELTLIPKQRKPRQMATVQGGIHSSIGLLFQGLLPFLLFNSSCGTPKRTIRIHGLTHERRAPTVEYLQQVLLPMLAKIGLPPIHMVVESQAWAGRDQQTGMATFTFSSLEEGQSLLAFSLIDRGSLVRIDVNMAVPEASRPSLVLALQAEILSRISPLHPSVYVNFVNITDSQHADVFYVLLVAITSNHHRLGADIWFESDKMSRDRGGDDDESLEAFLARTAVTRLAEEIQHGGCVDKRLQDQLVIFQALADGVSVVDQGQGRPPTPHTMAAWATLSRFTGGSRSDGGWKGLSLKACAREK